LLGRFGIFLTSAQNFLVLIRKFLKISALPYSALWAVWGLSLVLVGSLGSLDRVGECGDFLSPSASLRAGRKGGFGGKIGQPKLADGDLFSIPLKILGQKISVSPFLMAFGGRRLRWPPFPAPL